MAFKPSISMSRSLRLLITDRRNGTFGVVELPELRTDLRLCNCSEKDFELPFGCPSRGRHQAKDARNDIRHLGDLIFIEGSISRKDERSCAHKSLNLLGNGTNAILSSAVSKFNEQLLERATDTNVGGDAVSRSSTGDCAENSSGYPNEPAREDREGGMEDDCKRISNQAAREMEGEYCSDWESEEEELGYVIPPQEAHFF